MEFLTDLKGTGDITVVEVQERLNSEALRYLAMSLENTMRVHYSQFIPENRRHLFYAQF